MHPKYNPTGIRTHDLQIITVHFMLPRCHYNLRGHVIEGLNYDRSIAQSIVRLLSHVIEVYEYYRLITQHSYC